MGFRDRLQQRSHERAGREIMDGIEKSLQGKPPWAMDVRMASISWTMGQNALGDYMTAYEQGDRAGMDTALEKVETMSGQAAEIFRRIPLEHADYCATVAAAIADTLRAGQWPPPDAVDYVNAWTQTHFT
jgi:hypothetical protein